MLLQEMTAMELFPHTFVTFQNIRNTYSAKISNIEKFLRFKECNLIPPYEEGFHFIIFFLRREENTFANISFFNHLAKVCNILSKMMPATYRIVRKKSFIDISDFLQALVKFWKDVNSIHDKDAPK